MRCQAVFIEQTQPGMKVKLKVNCWHGKQKIVQATHYTLHTIYYMKSVWGFADSNS